MAYSRQITIVQIRDNNKSKVQDVLSGLSIILPTYNIAITIARTTVDTSNTICNML